jgi:hypothetical protein
MAVKRKPGAEPAGAADPVQDQAAALLLEQSEAARRLPNDVRRELDSILRSRRNNHPGMQDLWRDLRLKERFHVTRRMFYEYARCLKATVTKGLCGEALEALAGLMAMPVEQGGHLHEAGTLLLLARVSDVLQKQELEPEQLCRLADAMSRQRTAAARAMVADLARRKFRQAVRARDKADARSAGLSMEQRVRRIYGIDMPAPGAGGQPVDPASQAGTEP